MQATECAKRSTCTLKRCSDSHFWSRNVLKHGMKQNMSENSKTLNSFIYLFCELYEIPKRTGRVDRGHTENCKINWLIFTRHRMHRIAPIYLYRRRSFRGLCEGPKDGGCALAPPGKSTKRFVLGSDASLCQITFCHLFQWHFTSKTQMSVHSRLSNEHSF